MEDIHTTPTPLAEAIDLAFRKIRIQESSFYTLFPSFKVSYPVYRWIVGNTKVSGHPLAPHRGHYEIKIPFSWSQYGIPRFGILAFTATSSIYTKWEVVFSPWKSEGDQGFKTIHWTNLYYIDYFSPIYVLENILWEAFQNENPSTACLE